MREEDKKLKERLKERNRELRPSLAFQDEVRKMIKKKKDSARPLPRTYQIKYTQQTTLDG